MVGVITFVPSVTNHLAKLKNPKYPAKCRVFSFLAAMNRKLDLLAVSMRIGRQIIPPDFPLKFLSF